MQHWTSTPRPPTPSVPLTKLLGRRGLTGTRLLLVLATTKASTLRGCTSTSTTAAATSTTATATSTTAAAASTTSAAASTTSTAATEAPTPSTTPTSTATPSASATASATAPTVPSITFDPLALAVAAPPTRSRRSPDLLIVTTGVSSPPVLYVDNKAMLALCREHRLEHRTKHIALRYFLARELQQRGQLHLAYMASEANTADIFTKAFPPGDHQRFCTMLVRRPSSPPPRVPLPSPLASSLPVVADPASDQFRAEHSTVTRLLATVVTDLSFESAAASALVTELVDFAAAYRLDYAASLVAESKSVYPTSVGGECALGTDVLEDRQENLQCLAAAAPHLVAMLLAPKGDPDAPDIPTPRSYAEAIAGSQPFFKARYVARGFSQREGVDFFQTFSPTPKMTTLWVLLHVAAQRDYELHFLDFSTAFLQGSLHEEIWLRRPPIFTGSFPPGTQWSLRRPVYGLRQAPREWHDTLRTTLAALGFAPSTAYPSLFLRTDTSLPRFYILVYVDDLVFAIADTEALALVKLELQKRHTCTDLGDLRSYLGLQITRDRARRTIIFTQSHMVQQVLLRFGFTWFSAQATPLATGHSLSAPPSDESVEPSGPYSELVGYLMYLMTCTRPDIAYLVGLLTRYVAPGRHRKVHMDVAKRVLRYLCSISGMGLVLGGRGDIVLTCHSDASLVDDLDTQRSSQGYTFSLGSDSVSWRATR
ncbi:unnamed protein product [Closterium sp. NIES-54]